MLEAALNIANNSLWHFGPNFFLEIMVDLDIECGSRKETKEHGRHECWPSFPTLEAALNTANVGLCCFGRIYLGVFEALDIEYDSRRGPKKKNMAANSHIIFPSLTMLDQPSTLSNVGLWGFGVTYLNRS